MTRQLRRIGITALGVALLVLGAVLVVLPGPAILVVPAGLGVLAWEYDWARELRDRLVARLRRGLRGREGA